jgi:3-keto-5-aminohexanoate cleavage enzyme
MSKGTDYMHDKLIIEVRANEYTMRDRNPHVPWSAEEIARDALACREAGASAFHFHPRLPDGLPDLTYESNQAIMKRIRSTCDILIHPTLGAAAQDSDPHVRIATIVRLTAEGLAPDVAPMDTGSSNADLLDAEGKTFTTEDVVYANSTRTLRVFAETLRELKVKPYLHLWNLVYVRISAALYRQGLLDGPLWAGFCLSGDDAPIHHPNTRAGLDAYLSNLPQDVPFTWAVNAFHGDLLELAPFIIERGGHIAIGIGDHHYADRGFPDNAALVRRVAEIARGLGREIATPDEARQILHLSLRGEKLWQRTQT